MPAAGAERFTIDANVLVYAVDAGEGDRHEVACSIIDRAMACDCRLGLQAVSEFFTVASRKRLMPRSDAADQARDWLAMFPSFAVTEGAVRAALEVAVAGTASYWDALLIAAAAEAGCAAILTEDLADGSTLFGVRIVNPFASDELSASARALLGLDPA
jgi:predicted nucleic acid-binding protein